MTSANVEAVELMPCPNPWCASHTENPARREAYAPYAKDYTGGYSRIVCAVCPIVGPDGVDGAAAGAAWNTRPSPAPSEQRGTIAEAVGRLHKACRDWEDRANPTETANELSYIRFSDIETLLAALALPDREAIARAVLDGWYEGNEEWDSPHNGTLQMRAYFAADAILALAKEGGNADPS